jgi:hypothetical protein
MADREPDDPAPIDTPMTQHRYLANWFLPSFQGPSAFPNDELVKDLVWIRTKQKIALIDMMLSDKVLRGSLLDLEPLDLP